MDIPNKRLHVLFNINGVLCSYIYQVDQVSSFNLKIRCLQCRTNTSVASPVLSGGDRHINIHTCLEVKAGSGGVGREEKTSKMCVFNGPVSHYIGA